MYKFDIDTILKSLLIYSFKSFVILASLYSIVLKLSSIYSYAIGLLKLLYSAFYSRTFVSSAKDFANIVFKVVKVLKKGVNLFLFVSYI